MREQCLPKSPRGGLYVSLTDAAERSNCKLSRAQHRAVYTGTLILGIQRPGL